ncbi:MAG: mqo [Verrucomicrobiales bacterium]|nr:mqo [Verrucomicrobiales bacterium]
MIRQNPDIILIGSGIMSANLGALLKCLDPALSIQVYEAADGFARESSDGWNNAGTGHAGLCELSYTPNRNPDGTVDVSNAVHIFRQFAQSKHFWAAAVAEGMIDHPEDFITPLPHISFVHGQEQVDFLKARHAALTKHPEFAGMEYTTDPAVIAAWAPLLMRGRAPGPVAATRMASGTDVNFGVLARKLLTWLAGQEKCGIASGHRVTGLTKTAAGWEVAVREKATGATHVNRAPFVFIGAGGGTLTLLQKAGIPEADGLGGFPIGGQWLVCANPALVESHHAKVYGQALAAAPTMAVPHLDTRFLDGKKHLLFGPFAAWTTKFLHGEGRHTDLPFSVRPGNLATLLRIGFHNTDLIGYLMEQGTQSMADRLKVLRVFFPAAREEDWRLIDAGIRVQAIKKTDGKAGIVHYGTEVLTPSDGSLSALLGASPGASVSVSIVLQVIRKCFPALLADPAAAARLEKLIPKPSEST